MWLGKRIIKLVYWLLGVHRTIYIVEPLANNQVSGLRVTEIPKIGELIMFDGNIHYLVTNVLHNITFYRHEVFIMIEKK